MIKPGLVALIVCALGLAGACGASGMAQEATNTLRIDIRQPGQGPASETIDLPLGQAAVINIPHKDVADVVVANPTVADAVVRSANRAFVMSQAVGRTNIFFFADDGQLILDLNVRVERDMSGLQDALNRFIPDGRVRAESLNSNVVLSGTVPSAAAADTALNVARRWVDDPEDVISLVTIEGRDQVMLKVRIVEMQRNVVRQLGVNLNGTTNFGEFRPPVRRPLLDGNNDPVFDQFGNQIWETVTAGSFGSNNTIRTQNTFGVAGAALGGLTGGLGYNNYVDGVLQSSLGATLNALERVGLVRTLAEPNLTAISGEAANFLAGGEFPVPNGRDRDGNITLQFKPFGVGLGFTPVVMSEGRISLRISTEVSELSNEGSITLGGTTIRDDQGNVVQQVDGLNVPALSVSRAETTVELPSGGSMVLAGLIKEETRQAIDSVPGVGALPVLGALFRSRDFVNNETELVIIVTPYLVDPVGQSELTDPGYGFAPASTLAGFLLGRLNVVYAAPGADIEGKGWSGPIGFVVE